ncbi:GOLPH3/VPS74 family protein [Saccharopolyspora rectivirgula]|uniref:GPP34 family phosphoprotein n=1 Tax=Saccharopolyspora rectivirgula TaxID=28042 RepID=A0A073B1E4_9PSEU|nr:GPP34 family phosphoprotein [Saccharopolyspora rectivirgula]KEI45838.1 hypothetical protein GU90_01850 [Saccharopolyspora rectivirgula]
MTGITLPEEFVLLLHKDNGSYYATADRTGAAELAELARQHRIAIDGKNIELTNSEPSEVPWIAEAVELLAQRQQKTGGPVAVSWFLERRKTRDQHAESLVRRGLMRHEQREFLGLFRSNRYYPDHNARQALIGELRAVASGQQPLDNRLALLAALVHTSGLSWALKFSSAERKRLKKISAGEELGNAVEAAVADLNAVLTTTVIISATAAGSE